MIIMFLRIKFRSSSSELVLRESQTRSNSRTVEHPFAYERVQIKEDELFLFLKQMLLKKSAHK